MNKIIEKSIDRWAPDVVYTHAPDDANNDHRLVYRSTVMATRPCNVPRVKKLMCYEVPSSSGWSFEGSFDCNVFVALTKDELTKKIEALKCYERELRSFPFPRSEEGIRAWAKFRGMQCGVKYAEGFRLVRSFVS